MNVNIQISDSDHAKGKYHRVEIAEISMNITQESIPAVCALISIALEQHLITAIHAATLGVNPERPEPIESSI